MNQKKRKKKKGKIKSKKFEVVYMMMILSGVMGDWKIVNFKKKNNGEREKLKIKKIVYFFFLFSLALSAIIKQMLFFFLFSLV